MNRALLAVAATVLLASVRRALPVMLGVSSVPFTPGSVVVAYAALTKPPIEAAITASLCGLVVDGLSGIPLGVSSFALVVTLLLSRLGIRFVPRARGVGAFAFAFLFAVVQAVIATTLLTVFGDRGGSVHLSGLVTLGVVDGALALVVFPLLHSLSVRLGLEDRDSTLGERLATRT